MPQAHAAGDTATDSRRKKEWKQERLAV